MNPHRLKTVLINRAPLQWVKDREQILVLNEQRHETHVLHGLEAVVWDWLVLAYPYPKIIQLLSALLALPCEESEQRLQVILQDWRAAGLLEIEAK